LLISALTAVLAPVALGGVLAGASTLAQTGDTNTLSAKVPRPAPPPSHRRTLSSLGRASAVAWIRVGHVGR
jgi:hypothetical protein